MRLVQALICVLLVCVVALPLTGCAVILRGNPVVSEVAKQRAWSRVTKLPRPSDVILTRENAAAASRTFGAADDSALITLNLADPTLPGPVKRTLRTMASDHPLDLFSASSGQAIGNGRVRLDRGGIFLDGIRVAALDQVLERTPKANVSEVRRVHRATRRGLMWGFLAGAGLGLTVTLSACGTNWSQETSSCSNLTPIWVFVGPSYGALIGAAVGATSKTSTVVYTAR